MSLYLPEGFAHGFQALTDNCELFYLHTNFYDKNSEAGLNAFDSKLNIQWPLPISELSDRDRNFEMVNTDFYGVDIR